MIHVCQRGTRPSGGLHIGGATAAPLSGNYILSAAKTMLWISDDKRVCDRLWRATSNRVAKTGPVGLPPSPIRIRSRQPAYRAEPGLAQQVSRVLPEDLVQPGRRCAASCPVARTYSE